jgi:3'-5' exoribonuclease
VWVKDIREEDDITGCYLVKQKRLATTKTGKPYLNLALADRTGTLEGKVWDNADHLSSLFQEGDIIEIKGRAGSYRGQIQITVFGLNPIRGEMDPALFLESTAGDLSEMMKSLRGILKGVKNIHLRSLNERFLADSDFMAQFKTAPAAKHFHHNYLGGLLEHTLSVCQMVSQIADHYPQLDKDLLLTASFLHDIGKIREFEYALNIDYTDEGRLIGHLVMGVTMMEAKLDKLKNFPREMALRLKHLILSHHGEYEFGSPKRPKFLEAFVLHQVDDLDAKIVGLGRYMEKDQQGGAWTDFNRLFGRPFLKGKISSVEEVAGDREESEERQGTLF